MRSSDLSGRPLPLSRGRWWRLRLCIGSCALRPWAGRTTIAFKVCLGTSCTSLGLLLDTLFIGEHEILAFAFTFGLLSLVYALCSDLLPGVALFHQGLRPHREGVQGGNEQLHGFVGIFTKLDRFC